MPIDEEIIRRRSTLASLATQVYERLRAAIIRGELAPDSKLVELDIAQNMGTSQGTIREALQRLEREGLVERRSHRGTYVTALSSSEIYECFVIRSTIEGFAARRATQAMTDGHVRRLEQLHKAMGQSADRNALETLIEYDLEFHRCICEWSGSHLLLNSWVPLYSSIQRFIFQTHPAYFGDLHSLADTHLPLIGAFRARDVETAVARVQEHVMLIWSMMKTSDISGDPSNMTISSALG
jgi:DNA-binding GntR family transcriptional regulator